MKTSEFTTELENYKKELNNRNNIGRGDIIRLIKSYVELSVLDYMYLEKAYERKNNEYFVYSYDGEYKEHSHKILEQLYNVANTYYYNNTLAKYTGETGRGLYKSQNTLRDIKNIIRNDHQEFFKEYKLDDLFRYLDMISFSGTAIVGNAFIDYMNKNVVVAYDKFYNNDINEKSLKELKVLHFEKGEYNNYFFPVCDDVIDFELGNTAYRYTGYREYDGVLDLVDKMYNKNMNKEVRKEKVKTKQKLANIIK